LNKPFDLADEIEKALWRQKIRDALHLRKTGRDKIQIIPVVSFFEGTLQNPIRHIATSKGHLVNSGLISLLNFASGAHQYSGQYTTYASADWMYSYAVGPSGVPNVPSIRLGTGNGATTGSTTGLVAIVNTPPNAISGSTSNPSAGHYLSAITATWNSGALSAITVTEAGLWAFMEAVLRGFAYTSGQTPSATFVDRVSSTDGDFSSFVVNTSVPLSVQYQINFNFV
jgi:hypothetical protein